MTKSTAHPFFALSITLFGFMVSSWAQANFYEIEMTVFAHNDNNAAQEQTWPVREVQYPSTALTWLSNSLNVTDYVASYASNQGLPLLEPSQSKHNDALKTLTSANKRTVLFHETWLQKIEQGKSDAAQIIIQGGKNVSNISELGGTVRFYSRPAPDNLPPTIHIQTTLWRLAFEANASNTTNRFIVPVFITPNDTVVKNTEASNISRIATLNIEEIVNRNKLHYIDGPLFSVLLEIRPYTAISQE